MLLETEKKKKQKQMKPREICFMKQKIKNPRAREDICFGSGGKEERKR